MNARAPRQLNPIMGLIAAKCAEFKPYTAILDTAPMFKDVDGKQVPVKAKELGIDYEMAHDGGLQLSTLTNIITYHRSRPDAISQAYVVEKINAFLADSEVVVELAKANADNPAAKKWLEIRDDILTLNKALAAGLGVAPDIRSR